MPNRRSYTDDQLRDAVARASCWSDVTEALGKGRAASAVWPRKRALHLGLDTARLDRYPGSMIAARKEADPFSGRPILGMSGRLGLSTAISWFLTRGYNPAIPVEPCLYDLVVESDQGLQRVQVKTTDSRTSVGYYRAKIARAAYDSEAAANANGRFRTQPYVDGAIDFFFIACGDGTNYLIPQDVVSGLKEVTLTRKYAAFKA